jgi:tetratricopeptide (TPR) repeat protein
MQKLKRLVDVCTRAFLISILLVLVAAPSLSSQTTPALPLSDPDAQSQYRAGLALVESGKIDEAISAFKKGLETAPQDKVLLDATGAAYSMKGDLEVARGYFTRSLDIDPRFGPARQNLGITLFALGRYAEAEDQFKSLDADSGPSRSVANVFLGMIAEKRSDCRSAVALMENEQVLVYQYPDAILSFADCEYQVGNLQQAEQALTAFDHLSTKSPSQYEKAVEIYRRLGQNQKASEELRDLQPENGATPALGLKDAVRLEKAGRQEEAQKELEGLAASQPTGDVLLELARVAKERGDFGVAMQSLRRAGQIEPNREDSYLEFSTICADHGNDTLALEAAEIGLSHVPDSYRLTVQKGAVQEKLGHLSDAESTLKTAMGLQNDNSIAMLSLAVVLAHGGRTDEAERLLATAIQRFPDNYYMYYFRGKLLAQFGAAKEGSAELRDAARRSFEASIRLNPDYADSYYQLSDLYMANSPKLAERALDKCLKLDPNHIGAQYALARLYIRTGRKEEGQALLARLKTQQHSEEQQQQRQLRIDVAQN